MSTKKTQNKATAKKPKQGVIMHALASSLANEIIPAYSLTVTQEEHFREIARELERHGILLSIDRFQITHAAVILDKLVQSKELLDGAGLTQTFDSGASNISAELSAFKTIHKEWMTCVAQLGLTPASREKILKKPQGNKSQKDNSGSKPGLSIPK